MVLLNWSVCSLIIYQRDVGICDQYCIVAICWAEAKVKTWAKINSTLKWCPSIQVPKKLLWAEAKVVTLACGNVRDPAVEQRTSYPCRSLATRLLSSRRGTYAWIYFLTWKRSYIHICSSQCGSNSKQQKKPPRLLSGVLLPRGAHRKYKAQQDSHKTWAPRYVAHSGHTVQIYVGHSGHAAVQAHSGQLGIQPSGRRIPLWFKTCVVLVCPGLPALSRRILRSSTEPGDGHPSGGIHKRQMEILIVDRVMGWSSSV